MSNFARRCHPSTNGTLTSMGDHFQEREQPLISSVSEARATDATLHPFQAYGRVERQKPAHDHAAEVDGVKREVDMFSQDLVGHRHGVQFDGGLSSLPSAWQREGTTSPAWRHNSTSSRSSITKMDQEWRARHFTVFLYMVKSA